MSEAMETEAALRAPDADEVRAALGRCGLTVGAFRRMGIVGVFLALGLEEAAEHIEDACCVLLDVEAGSYLFAEREDGGTEGGGL